MALSELETMRGAGHRASADGGRPYVAPAVVLALLLAIFLIYTPTIRSMVKVWSESATFTHGFIVAPLCVWFIWSRGHALAQTQARPFWPALLVCAGAGGAWMLGELSASQSISHFALVFLAIGSVIAVFGLAWARALAFPLAFLVLTVPFGEDVVPVLMNWTADFTVAALKLSGVPVLREGNDFTIPSGRWSVVEACSGARYLLASFVAGTLYAWIMYRSPVRRATFMLVSLVAPIVANWLRAYMIVMLGHLSDNALAAGIDHLIYGWVFFGFVILVVFALGARWREDDQQGTASLSAAKVVELDGRRLAPALVLVLAIAVVWPALTAGLLAASDKRPVHLTHAAGQSGWVATLPAVLWQPRLEEPRVLAMESFRRNDVHVNLHVGVYRDQRQGSELVNSQNQFSTDWPINWRQVMRGSTRVALPGREVVVRSALIRNLSGEYLRVWQWYWLDPEWSASDTRAKIDLTLDRLLLRSDTSAWVVLSTGHDPARPQQAEATLRAFLLDMSTAIDAALAATAQH